jgi:3',5'-cyclic AMP phosphodiesterase CpdA
MRQANPGSARYVELIHLSDLHFGDGHRFSPGLTVDGAVAAEPGFPSLADVLLRDLLDPANEPPRPTFVGADQSRRHSWHVPPIPKVLCLTGDFAVSPNEKEFTQAANFVERICQPAPLGLGLARAAVFVCPGNHDLDWNATTDALRWHEYAGFLNAIYSGKFEPDQASRFGGVEICKEAGVLVLSLNSEMAVFNTDKNKTRGDLSQAQLLWAETMLENIPATEREGYIKVAMVHHHPILLPALAESGRGYDAISGSQHLLTRLHRYGFHVILHGHKHYPHTFHEDVRNAFEHSDEHSLVVVAGGTCGSTGLPDKPGATQTYNRIRIHWCAEQSTTRVQVVTRGLVRHHKTGAELLAAQWRWETLATDDRSFLSGRRTRVPSAAAMRYELPEPEGHSSHAARDEEYRRTRGNFPVAEIKPSLLPGQTNEVHLRIARHGVGRAFRKSEDDPVAVTWSAGCKFPKVRITRDQDPEFCAVFAYYDSALMQAELEFNGDARCLVFIYAPMLPPTADPSPPPKPAGDQKLP